MSLLVQAASCFFADRFLLLDTRRYFELVIRLRTVVIRFWAR